MKQLKISQIATLVITVAVSTSSGTVSASAGKIVYGYGDNYAIDHDGNRRDVAKGSTINAGDTLVTGRGRMHVRLRDGGYVSVYPNSEYRIEAFEYEGGADTTNATTGEAAVPAKKEQGIFNLLKGAARQVTGLLGKFNRDNFKFKTPVATIGIRGTGFFAKLCQSDCYDADGNLIADGLYVKNNTGVITMTTDAGDIALAQGQSAFAASKSDSPQQILQPPVVYNVVNPDIEQYDFDERVVDTRQNSGSGETLIEPIVPPTTASTLKVLEYVTSLNTFSPAPIGDLDTANPNDSVQMNGTEIGHFEDFTGPYIDTLPLTFDKGSAVLAEQGENVALGVVWNRWSGGYSLDEGGTNITSLDNNLHLIGTDNLTAVVPSGSRGTVNYQSTGGTSPTITGSGVVTNQTGTTTVDATINYATAEIESFNLVATFSNATMNTNLLTLTPLTGVTNQVSLSGGCSGTDCGANGLGVSGEATLNLVGPNAEGIYGSYNLTNLENSVTGNYVAEEVIPQLRN